jgi:hypothetical protein
MKTYAKTICLLSLLAIASGNLKAESGAQPVVETSPTSAVASADSNASRPKSVFVIAANSKEGRNPFFPRSKTEVPVVTQRTEAVEQPGTFILNGITSPPKPTAMINGRTFEPGEAGDVKFPNGKKVSIKCLEIHDDTVIIMVGAQRLELRMRGRV